MKEKYHDTIVTGAGSGGIQLDYYFQKHQRDYIILEEQTITGSAVVHFPRYKKINFHE